MKYVGSKNKLSKELAPIIQSYITEDTKGYIEPFVGGANMIDKIKCKKKIGCDIHKELIASLKAISGGWLPPKNISEETFNEIKNSQQNYPDYLLGYIGFQLTFGSMWMGSYRRDKIGKRKYDEEAFKNVAKQANNLKDIKFKNISYRNINPDKLNGWVIYCDPPYKGTIKYKVEEFDYLYFYEWCKRLAKNNIVLISEYSMPSEFECIWSKETIVQINNVGDKNKDNKTRIEKLFTYKNITK